jgi:glutamate-ammonia-ligase adenylyltransferase
MMEDALPTGLFQDHDHAARNLVTLHEAFIRSGTQHTFSDFTRALEAQCRTSPDPDMALTNLLRFSEAAVSKTSLFNDLVQYPVVMELLMKVFGSSQFFADILVRDPGLFRWLTTTDALSTRVMGPYLRSEADRLRQTFEGPDRRLNALRRMHRREILRIGAMDLLGAEGLARTTEQLSELADCIATQVYQAAWEQLSPRYGPSPPTPFAIIGLGKHGGRELNYSSDIDVLFVYREDGESTTTEGRPFTHEECCNRFAERIIQLLSQPTQEGYFYRVDTRLRPESGAGPLTRSLARYLMYYESRGELWERQMLIKARFVAGDARLGEEFIKQLQPFVYPRTFFHHPGESAARIKARIETTVGDSLNVKLMAGGIRDVEFIAQTLQLINGGRVQGLREGNTLRALDRLHASDLLSEGEARALVDAYLFYRTLEHRLQTKLNTQTHVLPADERLLRSLAKQVGLEGGEDLVNAVRRHAVGVKAIFDRTLSVTRGEEQAGITPVIDGGVGEEEMKKIISSFGLHDTRQAVKNLRVLVSGSALSGAGGIDTRGREAFREVAGELFEGVARTPVPDLTLRNLALLASAQKFPDQMYALLKEPGFRRLVLNICAISPKITRGLSADPLLFELLSTDSGILAGLAADAPAGAEDPVLYKSRQELRAGVRHVLGFSTQEELHDELTSIADHAVSALFEEEARRLRLVRPPLAVFALGKHGSRELGFDADLDLLFISRAVNAQRRLVIEKLASSLVRRLSAVSEKGMLYTVDTRLRPEGKNAPLVAESEGYRRYLQHRASLWERQSLTRLRFVCGDSELAQDLLRVVSDYVFASALPAGWVESAVAMRRKMETRSRVRGSEMIDVKLGRGGMVDIEFLIQMIQLKLGGNVPELRRGTVGGLLGVAARHVFDPEETGLLGSAYKDYRRLEMLMRITLEDRNTVLPRGPQLEVLARCHNRTGGAELSEQLRRTAEVVRKTFLEVSERLK